MRNPTRGRPIVALIAAYAVALQALLWPLSLAASHPLQASLCSEASATTGGPAPAGHDSSCPCAAGCGMQCCVRTFVGPARAAVVLVLRPTGAITLTPTRMLAPVIRVANRSPQVPRAPPAI